MGCNCHGDSRLNIENVMAFEQCRFCGMKHLTTAWSLWNEFTYQELNLAAISGQLRLAVNHLQYIERDIALQIRDLSIKIEERKLNEVKTNEFEKIILTLQDRIYEAFPDMKKEINRFLGA
jgi:hypothetical protein